MKIFAVIHLLVRLGEALILPHEAVEAFDHYKGWALHMVTSTPESYGQKLLEGPKGVDPNPEPSDSGATEDQSTTET
jgi:hypothetical protein